MADESRTWHSLVDFAGCDGTARQQGREWISLGAIDLYVRLIFHMDLLLRLLHEGIFHNERIFSLGRMCCVRG